MIHDSQATTMSICEGEKTMTFAKSAKSNGNGLDLNGSGSHAWLAVSGSHLALMLLAH
jgi:hypothetical protein